MLVEDVHAPHGRRWSIERRVLEWKPRAMGAGLLDDLPGDRAALRRQMLGTRSTAYERGASAFQGWVQTSTTTLVVGPLYVLQGIAWVIGAAGMILFRETTRRPWTVRAWSKHPTPLDHEEQVVGWLASRQRVKGLAVELSDGANPDLNPP